MPALVKPKEIPNLNIIKNERTKRHDNINLQIYLIIFIISKIETNLHNTCQHLPKFWHPDDSFDSICHQSLLAVSEARPYQAV